MESIRALSFRIDEVGKHVKGSKKRFVWEVVLNGKHYSLTLDYSYISGKVKVAVDNKVLYENELPSNVSFQYPFILSGFSLNLIQQGDTFELRINNKVFSHLYNQHRTNQEFKQYEDQVKDIKTSNFAGDSKVITVNIGASKKKNITNQASGVWNNFGNQAFPNFFDKQGSKQTFNQTSVKQQSTNVDLLQDNSTKITIEKSNLSQIQPPATFDFFQENKKQTPSNIDLFSAIPSNSNPQYFNTSAIPIKQTNNDIYSTSYHQRDLNPITFPHPQKQIPVTKNDDLLFNIDTLLPPPSNTLAPNNNIFNMDSHFMASNIQPEPSKFTTGIPQQYNMKFDPPQQFNTGIQFNKPIDINFMKQPVNQFNFIKQSPKQINFIKQPTLDINFTKQPSNEDMFLNNFSMDNGIVNQSSDLYANQSQLNALNNNQQPKAVNVDDFSTLQMLYKTNQGLQQTNNSYDMFNTVQMPKQPIKSTQSPVDFFELAKQ